MQEGLPAFAPADHYRYVLLDIWFLTVTRRSVALGAKAVALTFTALQARKLLWCPNPFVSLSTDSPGRQGACPSRSRRCGRGWQHVCSPAQPTCGLQFILEFSAQC